MSAPVAQQIVASMKIIMGLDGTDEGTLDVINLLLNAFRDHIIYTTSFIFYSGV